jgi:hypothetical protein
MTSFGGVEEICPICGEKYIAYRMLCTSSWSHRKEDDDKTYEVCPKCAFVWQPKCLGTAFTFEEAIQVANSIRKRKADVDE